MQGPPDIANRELAVALDSLASGPSSFGYSDEWTEWLHYFTPRVPRLVHGWETASCYEQLITAILARYPDVLGDMPSSSFADDILSVIGQTLMSARFRIGGNLQKDTVLSSAHSTSHGYALLCGGSFSATLFFALKYLRKDQLATWWRSVTTIEDPVWTAKLLRWLAASAPLLLGVAEQPASLASEYAGGAGWDGCWSLQGAFPSVDPDVVSHPFLPLSRRALFLTELRRELTASRLLDWCVSFESWCELAGIDSILWTLESALDETVAQYDLRS